MNRRDMVKGFGLGAAAGVLGFLRPANDAAGAQAYAKATQGLPPLKITKVRAILTAPERIRLCVVKVETS
jgi:mannonate dehydratase